MKKETANFMTLEGKNVAPEVTITPPALKLRYRKLSGSIPRNSIKSVLPQLRKELNRWIKKRI